MEGIEIMLHLPLTLESVPVVRELLKRPLAVRTMCGAIPPSFNLKPTQELFQLNLPFCPIDFATLEIER